MLGRLFKRQQNKETAELKQEGEAERPLAASPAAPETEILPEKIAQRAYELWCERGRPEGTADRDWQEAEEQLRAERAPVSRADVKKSR